MANTVERKSKPITNQAILDSLINIKEEDITPTFIMDLFGEFNSKAKCYQFDTLVIPKGKYGNGKVSNIAPFTTTAGIWLFNKYFIEPHLFDVFQYVDEPITKKMHSKLRKKLSYAYMEDRVDLDAVKDFLNKTQIWMNLTTTMAWSWSEKMLTLTDHTSKKKDELKKKYAKELEAGDVVAAEKMEKELLKDATDYIGFDPGMDGFNSGAGGDIGNNFKNMYCMKGAIRNPDPNAKKQYDIAFSNYMDGISADEYATFCMSLSAGPYARANNTAVGGYWEKLFISAFQHLSVAEEGTDCGTKRTIKVLLTPDNVDDWMYNWMVIGTGNLVELTSQNMEKYFGKEVRFRFSSLCEYKKKTGCFCSKCAGNIWYKQGLKHTGSLVDIIPSTLKNKNMKAFHDSTVSTTEMDPMKVFNCK